MSYFLLITSLTISVVAFSPTPSPSDLGQFRFHLTPATFDVASQTCRAAGQVLAHISTVEEAKVFANFFLASEVSNNAAWIGVTRVPGTSRFVDELTGNIFFRNSLFFEGNNPDTNGFEDCVGVVTSLNFGILGAWDDFDCAAELPFACSAAIIPSAAPTPDLSHFHFNFASVTYAVARRICSDQGLALAHISTLDESLAFGRRFLENNPSTAGAWIGVTRIPGTNQFVDQVTQATILNTSPFFGGDNPDNTGGVEDCVGIVAKGFLDAFALNTVGLWNDFQCSVSLPFACSAFSTSPSPTPPVTGTPSASSNPSPSLKTSSPNPPWMVIIAASVGGIVAILLVAVVTYCIAKRPCIQTRPASMKATNSRGLCAERTELRRLQTDDTKWRNQLLSLIKSTTLEATVVAALRSAPFPGHLMGVGGRQSRSMVVPKPTDSPWQQLCKRYEEELSGIVSQMPVGTNAECYSVQHALAIRLYTLNDPPIFSAVNSVLTHPSRGRGEGGASPQLKAWLPFIKFLDTALKSLPKEHIRHNVKLYRSVNYVYPSPANHAPEQHFPKGAEFCWYSFSSSSQQPNVCENFWEDEGPRTLFVINAHQAYDISGISMFPSEVEVLFCPLSRFRVTHVDGSWSPIGKRLYDSVHLEQVV